MSDERCLPYRENLPAYALGALDMSEIPALEAHLRSCQDCQAELAEYKSMTSGLLLSIPPRTPPSELRRKLMGQLPSQRTRTRRLPGNLFRQFPLGQLAAAVVVIVLLGLNMFSNIQIRALQRQQAALAGRLSSDQTAIAMLAYPSTRALAINADVPGLAGSMLVDKDKKIAVLVLWKLPQVETGHTYQVWLIDADGKRTSGGLFTPIEGQGYTTATVHSPLPLGEFTGIGVTVEPAGGSPGPTGSRALSVDF